MRRPCVPLMPQCCSRTAFSCSGLEGADRELRDLIMGLAQVSRQPTSLGPEEFAELVYLGQLWWHCVCIFSSLARLRPTQAVAVSAGRSPRYRISLYLAQRLRHGPLSTFHTSDRVFQLEGDLFDELCCLLGFGREAHSGSLSR